MLNNLMKSRYFLGQVLFYRTTYGFGIKRGIVRGLHDDRLKVQEDGNEEIVVIPITDVLSIYEND